MRGKLLTLTQGVWLGRNTKIGLKVKDQGQMSWKSNNVNKTRVPTELQRFLISSFFSILRGQTDTLTDTHTEKKTKNNTLMINLLAELEVTDW